MSSAVAPPRGRWDNYVLDRGAGLRSFWERHLKDTSRRVHLVVGRGFDPRMNLGLELLLDCGVAGRLTVLALEFDNSPHPPSSTHSERARLNWDHLETICSSKAQVATRPVRLWSEDGSRRRAAQNAAEVFLGAADLLPFTDVVVDISALPRSIFFPLVAQLLRILDSPAGFAGSERKPPNLHILAAENPELDRNIREEGIDPSAEYLHSFSGGFNLEADEHLPRVWIPLLGEGQLVQLERINDHVKPQEMSPVIPSPSLNPRRGDDLVIEYHRFLFEELRIDPRNIIYAAEQNPFEVYRQLRRTIQYYRKACAARWMQICPLGVVE